MTWPPGLYIRYILASGFKLKHASDGFLSRIQFKKLFEFDRNMEQIYDYEIIKIFFKKEVTVYEEENLHTAGLNGDLRRNV